MTRFSTSTARLASFAAALVMCFTTVELITGAALQQAPAGALAQVQA
jgi:hypothetical protein